MLSSSYLQKLKEWADDDNRSLDIVYKSKDEILTVWIYDYEFGTGRYVKQGDALPTRDQLIKDARRNAEAIINGLG